ncbi:T9SS type A sorting domain-containing protein [Chitinophaga sp. HK235]|uniref:T9SS type A sorting domain-containing protein n=1 Tax=Chitinophaga sp. HK235 TaxID=2952571 RepID=UPI001BA78DAB|nr:T9SS type A sorting domain-containing protein [Chitinophaga sp. HK235]
MGQTLPKNVIIKARVAGNFSSYNNFSLDHGPFPDTYRNGVLTAGINYSYVESVTLGYNNLDVAEIPYTDIYPVDYNGLSGPSGVFYGKSHSYQMMDISVMSNVVVTFSYRMIPPNPIVVSPATPGGACGNSAINLHSDMNWPLFSDDVVTTSVLWEYNINGSWFPLDSTADYDYNFVPAEKIPAIKSAVTNVQFRCRVKADYGFNRVFYSFYNPNKGDIYTFNPPPPVVDVNKIQKTPACFGMDNGQVYIPGSAITSGFTTMRWILRKGNVTVPCDPWLAGGVSNCGDIQDWSPGAVPVDSGIRLLNIPKGDYSLWVINASGEMGSCFAPYFIPIKQFDELLLSNNNAPGVSCYGGSDGKISVTAAGGNGVDNGYFFTLKKGGVIVRPEQKVNGTTMTWQNLPAGDDYTAEVRDGTCPIKSINIRLTQPPPVTGQIVPTNPTCISPANGSITVTADAGPTNYKYNLYKNAILVQQSGITTARNYTFPGLDGGNYTIELLNADYAGCTGWTTTTILNTVTPLSLQLVARDSVSCYGGSDGRLQFSATGGVNSYVYTLTGSNGIPLTNTTGEFTSLSAGNYTMKVQTSTCNDQITQSFDVYQRSPLQVQLQGSNITCNGANDGLLKTTVSGGSSFYKYTWEQLVGGVWKGNSFWFSTDTKIEGLEPGIYRVTVTDSKSAGCSVTSSNITLTAPTAVQITDVTLKNAICMTDGVVVNIAASGGDGTYTYAWSMDDGTTFTNFTNGSALHTAGDYIFRVRDGKGCYVVTDVPSKVSLPTAALSFTTQLSGYNGFNISCNGAGDGKITIMATGGNGGTYTGYQYKLNNGSYQNTGIFQNLTAGVYAISVKDARGCEISGSVTLTQPSLYMNVTKQDIRCYGQSTGSITTTVSGGAAPYRLLLNGVAVNVNQVIPNLAKGDYNLSVTDANGCMKDTVVSIVYNYPALLAESATVNDIRCFGTQGNIALSATGGDGNYHYTISTDNWTTQQTYTSGGSLPAGSYAVRVADGQGCTTNFPDKLTITTPAAPVSFTAVLSDYNGKNISCAGGDNGTAQITATGGNGGTYSGYTYAVDNGLFTNISLLDHITAGNHLIKVKDGRGCVVSNSYTFTESSQALNIVLVSKQDVKCAAIPGGSIKVAGSGGTGSLQYSIDGNTWQSSPDFTGLAGGDYIITVRDANSCGITMPVKINSLSDVIVIDQLTRNDIVCYGGKGTISLQSHGGSGTLINEYSLNGGAYTSFNNNTTLGPGNYTLRVKDALGCYSPESEVVSITAPSTPINTTITTSSFNGMQISCYGLTDGAFSITATGGNEGGYSGYQYSFNNSPYTNTSSYNSLAAGNYPLKIKDGRGCVISQNVVLQQPAAPVSLSIAGIEHLTCGANATGKISVQSAGGVAPYTYMMNNGDWQSTPVFAALPADNYSLQVKDANGCAARSTATVNTLYPAITATAAILPVTCYGAHNGNIKVNVAGGDGNYNYQWNVAGIAGNNAQNLPAGNYGVTITDGKGCSTTSHFEVSQPAVLTMEATAAAICDGLGDGVIRTKVQGGTLPYQFALNKGGWAIQETFTNLSAGNYEVAVKDANGCAASQLVSITKANVKPDVNFLVASKKNAMDTLVIKEISLPVPDEVSWTYHPQAILLGYDRGTPLIKFTQAGTYWVEMKARFGVCTYTLRKELTISPYDPIAGPGNSLPVNVIDVVTLSPNPNNGYFHFKVKLNRKQQVLVTVFDMNGLTVGRRQYTPALSIDDQFDISNAKNGTYILRVITENESKDIRFIIAR